MALDKPAVVIDAGSYLVKAGFSCDNHPVAIFRTLVARPSRLNGKYGRADYYDVYIGDEALDHTADYDLTSPVVDGEIVHWDNMERIWHRVFYKELRVAPEDRGCLLACSPLAPMSEKLKCVQVFFEVLNIPSICIQPTSVLALYGSGVTSGLTVDLGYDKMSVDPAYEGGPIKYAHMTSGFAAKEVSEFVNDSFVKRDIDLGVNAKEILSDIVRENVYVTPNSAMSRKDYKRLYELPSGETIDVSQEAFLTGEMFFQPELVMGKKTHIESMQDTIIMSCMKCDSDIRDDLFGAIVMAGGLSMIPGIGSRLKLAMEDILNRPVNVVTSEESYVVSWMGGAAFAEIKEGQKIWVTKKQFEDHGARIVNNRFM